MNFIIVTLSLNSHALKLGVRGGTWGKYCISFSLFFLLSYFLFVFLSTFFFLSIYLLSVIILYFSLCLSVLQFLSVTYFLPLHLSPTQSHVSLSLSVSVSFYLIANNNMPSKKPLKSLD